MLQQLSEWAGVIVSERLQALFGAEQDGLSMAMLFADDEKRCRENDAAAAVFTPSKSPLQRDQCYLAGPSPHSHVYPAGTAVHSGPLAEASGLSTRHEVQRQYDLNLT